MSELLSQDEIDALFDALTTGEIDVKEIQEEEKKQAVKEYNFARPAKFSREHLRTLEIMCENYARLVSNYLSGYLRIGIPVQVISAEAMTFSEFNNSLSNPVVLAILDVKPLTGPMLLELSPNLCFAFMERILGGAGRGMEKIREFTAIESTILDKIVQKMVSLLREPWENVIEMRPRLNKIETNSQFINLIAPNEMVALVTFNIAFGGIEGLMNLCIPHIVIEPVMDKINTRFRFQSGNDSDEIRVDKNVEALLKRTNIPLRAVLGTTTMTVREFLQLEVDDVIMLDREINSYIDFYVGNVLKFKVSPGVYKNKSAVQIKEILRKEDD
ncbi:MAG: flagellar motor switch protein FliM [Epulopiscium sp. Nele67-Bin001]|nr:MAG: flagellar motor switch protein FliM [Epulopiscium sp. Nuni2H_MBin001]OON92016.1 MAG: flagellar motor switch protein FliM [Epulopiscium sp. Nele67-Bin001]